MTSETLTCPYCNAAIGVQPGLTSGQKIICPRCGDTFPLRPHDAIVSQPHPVPEETRITANAPRVQPSLSSRRSQWLVASLVVGVMLLMAGGGLAFMLLTQNERRSHDTNRPPRRPGRQPGVPEPALTSVAPDKLTGLSYVPSGVNFLVGAHITELLANPVGVQMLRGPIKLGESEYRLESVPGWVGLRPEDIDHLVFAARVEDAVIPPFFLILRTTQPYEDEQMRQRLKATRLASAGKKKLYSFRTPHKDIPLNAWFADERTLVLALFADQLESLRDQPVEDLQQLPDEVRSLLKTRRESVAPVWAVGHSPDWSRTSAAKFLGRMKKEDLERLAALRTFGIWFVPDKMLDIKGAIECKNAAAARELNDYFRTLRGDDPMFKTMLDGPWLTLQWQTNPDFRRLLKE